MKHIACPRKIQPWDNTLRARLIHPPTYPEDIGLGAGAGLGMGYGLGIGLAVSGDLVTWRRARLQVPAREKKLPRRR